MRCRRISRIYQMAGRKYSWKSKSILSWAEWF